MAYYFKTHEPNKVDYIEKLTQIALENQSQAFNSILELVRSLRSFLNQFKRFKAATTAMSIFRVNCSMEATLLSDGGVKVNALVQEIKSFINELDGKQNLLVDQSFKIEKSVNEVKN